MFGAPSPEAVAIAQTYGLWIQTGAICLSAVAALLLIIWTQRVASKRATLDLILMDQTDQGHIKNRQEFIKLREQGHLVQWAAPDKAASNEVSLVRAALNKYELVAIGIFQRTIHQKLYKRWCRTTLVADWIACKPFIMQLRQNTGNSQYFCEFERLARRWATKEEKTRT